MSKFFINRPIVAMVIAILMVIIGVVSLLALPVAQFPNIVPPEVVVMANYPGADARTLEESVATPLEAQISGVDNMSYMYSINSASGQTQIIIDFDVKTDPNIDQVLTQMRTALAQPQLPALVNTAGVQVLKSLSSPLLLISLSSPHGTYDNNFLANYGYINLVDELTRVPGVARTQVFGGQYAMRIWVQPDRLAKLGVTIPQIIAALQAQNNVNPAGQIGGDPVPAGQQFTYTVRTQGRLTTPEEFGDIILRSNPDASTLRLKDVARIELGAQSYSVESRYNGGPAAVMPVYQLPGSNAVQVAQAVRERMAQLATRFPRDLTYTVSLDTTASVSAGIREIVYTLLEALALVVLVVYVFLQSWRATLIPLLAVPVSLIGTFAVFPMLGFSINTLSLFGLVLAIGLVVDDAIVVVEAVERHIEEGMPPREAAFNALSLSPALAALLLKPRKKRRGPLGWFFGWFNRGFRRATEAYVGFSGVLLRKAAISLLFLAVIAGAAYLLGGKLPGSFLPEEDYGYVFVALQLPDASSLQRTSEAARKVEDIVLHTPGVQGCTSVLGFSLLSRVQSTYGAFFFVTLKPWEERKRPEEQYGAIRNHLTRELQKVPDGIAFSFAPPAIPGVGTSGGVTYILEDRSGGDLQFLTENVNKFMAAARKRKELVGVTNTYLPDVPQEYVNVDRAKVSRQGINIADVYQTLGAFMGGYLVNYFNRFGRQWQVYVEAEGNYRERPRDIGQYYVANNRGQMVPLSAVAEIRSITGPEFTMRYNEYHAAQINAAAAPGYSSAQAMAALEEVFRQTMPREMGFDYTGMSYQEQQASHGVPPMAIFGLSLLFVFLILAAQYESWSLPFSVLLGTPIAVFGAYLFLWLRGFENDVYAQIGLVMLIGLSAKNAILIVEFAKHEYEGGKSIEEAALTGARIRLRPILMTAFAFILGCVPLWVASGSGAVSRRIMGTAVIGGMLAASVVAIFLIPVTFGVVERVTRKVTGKGHA